jgi:hypothetical protein
MIGMQRGLQLRDLPRRIVRNLRRRGLTGTLDAASRFLGAQLYHRLADGIDIMSMDWDTLIILDAARADLLEEHSSFGVPVRRVRSPATHSWGYMVRSYLGRQLHDTVMVSANPYVHDIPEGVFHAVYPVVGDVREANSLDPSHVTDTALRAHEVHPQKRLIVHYMQPHAPYLHRDDPYPRAPFDEARQTGDTDRLRADYLENYRTVERHVHELISHLSGKTVITADHGEALGERFAGLRLFEHGHAVPVVFEVPLVSIPPTERRLIRSDAPQPFEPEPERTVEKHLRSLGYR